MANLKQTSNKGPIAWMASNSVAANLLMIVLLVGGLVFVAQIKKEVFPEFSLDTVSVAVSYPGASPEEVEQGIVLAVEQAVQGLDGVKEVTSTSSEGSGSVLIEALEGTDLQKLTQDVKTEVDRITSFPEEAEDPVISETSHQRQVLSVMVYGNQAQTTLRELAEQLRDQLISDPGVTQVELSEVSDLQISIEIPQEKLRAHNLTLEEVADRLRDASVDLPGGGIKAENGEVLVRMKDRRDYGRDFARIPVVIGNDGTQVLVEDIGTVIDGFEDDDIITTYDGQPAVRIDVYRVGEQTPISVSDSVKKAIETFKERLPSNVSVIVLDDNSEVYSQRMDLLLSNGYMGLGMVFLFLALFLEARLAFWVAMGIPISFLGCFLILPFLGISINMITMFAFLIALGIVVDDAIVVGENVFTMRQQGMPPLKAAIEGAKQIAMPVVFSVLTNIVAFMPLLFLPGVMGKIFWSIPVVVISVFAISLIESLLVLPAHLSHLGNSRQSGIMAWIGRYQQRVADGLMRFIQNVYRPFLDWCLQWRYATVAVGLGLLILSGAFVMSGRMGFTLMAKVESDYAYGIAELPYGSAVAKTEAVRDRLLAAASKVAEANGGNDLVVGMDSKIGGEGRDISGSHVVKIKVYLTAADVRPITTQEFVNQWRKEAGDIIGLEVLSFSSDRGGPGAGDALEFELAHSDVSTLEAAAKDLSESLALYPRVKNVDDGFSPGKEQLDFSITSAGMALGLTSQEVASQVRAAYYGEEVLRQQRGRNEIKVVVRRPENERVSEYGLEELMLMNSEGKEALLRDVVDIKRGNAYTSINRRNGRRVLSVTADVDPQNQANQVMSSVFAEVVPDLKAKYPGLNCTMQGKQADMSESTSSLFTGLLLAMLAIYALLAIPFKSYVQPLIIMFCIPFGAVGAIFGHILMGYSISLMSLLGIVALSGVVVNDSLVLIDYANKMSRSGKCAHDAVLDAGTARFRAIMLTTLTTFSGLAPMILETSMQARFLIPMALSLGFGILFATVITLVMVPAMYMILEDAKRKLHGLLARTGDVSLLPAEEK
ncbi:MULTISPECIES: efflux RND transporter permease subunit [unclassified Pseudodesulfovibrio]|uniref:efflux RND transporter permease subunit n=1 Tax=unclassified Pseudodesulfovibrio TaxID=2661612 RepID=UPI000FEBC493|nr:MULTISPECIES: efflux RND transporter permease subunit [unclassified Pseudodesulfovibrio]MCJ2164003.1 efflux RND transporter permease subunit [Pseudodesulfovibrio sp. S3-i]RWU05358.1 AcrB/AcrD/AcrF family protein [Pseudodesulfovibrio sp. S3]